MYVFTFKRALLQGWILVISDVRRSFAVAKRRRKCAAVNPLALDAGSLRDEAEEKLIFHRGCVALLSACLSAADGVDLAGKHRLHLLFTSDYNTGQLK